MGRIGIFLTDAVDFATDFNNKVNEKLDAENTESGIGKLKTEVTSAGNSAIRLLITVGLIAATISLIIAGLNISSRNIKKREEGKQRLVAALIGGAAVTGIAAIVMIVISIADGFLK